MARDNKKQTNSKTSDRRLAAGRAPASFLHSNNNSYNNNSQVSRKEKFQYSSNKPVDPNLTVKRQVGNSKWTDSSLLEWDPAHFRLFVGNLGPDANDELLYSAFEKYPSLSKAKVPMDKKSNKGYGFVAFSDANDYFKAFKEMNGKYVGQHPVQLKRAQTEIKVVRKNEKRGKNRNN